MVAKYGVIFLGWLFIFAFLQYWYNEEIGRYSMATGEGILVGLFRVNALVGWITLAAALMVFSWVGGYESAAASALNGIFHWPPWSSQNAIRFWGIILMFLTWVIMILGPVAYRIIEVIEAIAALASFFGMLIVAIATPDVAKYAGAYFAGFGQFAWPPWPGWESSDLGIWVTLIAYTGAGGIWNLGYSYWIRDKGLAMSAHIGRVTSPLTGEPEAVPSVGVGFRDTPENRELWKKWTSWLWADNLFGVMLNTLTIILTSILTFSILRPQGIKIPTKWNLVVEQAKWFEALFGEAGRVAMLLLGFFFLFDVFFTAGDIFARFIADTSYVVLGDEVESVGKTWASTFIGLGIILLGFPIVTGILQGGFTSSDIASLGLVAVYLLAVSGVLAFASVTKWPYAKVYYTVWSIMVVMGIVQAFLKSPGPLILLTGITNMFIMAFITTFLLYLSWFYLPKIHPAGEVVRPHWIHFIILLIIAIVFWLITGWYIVLKVG